MNELKHAYLKKHANILRSQAAMFEYILSEAGRIPAHLCWTPSLDTALAMALRRLTTTIANLSGTRSEAAFPDYTICVNCKHHYGIGRCLANRSDPEINYVTGKIELAIVWCSAVNDGKCEFFKEINE